MSSKARPNLKATFVMDRNLGHDKLTMMDALRQHGIGIVYNAENTGVTLVFSDGTELDFVMPDGKTI